ncbi:MAG: heme biosynthesis protein HemY [Zoogloeaceae bacterium]|jgi:HemY protein|nr:heme biosynthesis protein HemY [Zoogloeaceae bacterium]
MRGLIWLLGLVVLAVAASLLAHNEGLVLFVLPPWQAGITLNLFILLTILAFILAYGLIRGMMFSVSLPARARAYRQQREQKEAQAAVEEAIRLFFAGRYGHALRAAEGAWKAGQLASTAALIAARSAHRMREAEKVALWLERARASDPETTVATRMIAAEMALELGNAQTALTHLQELQRQHGRHIAALRLELRARQSLGDVQGVLKLVRQLEKRSGMSIEAAREIRRKAHQQALAQRKDDAGQLLDYYQALPKKERTPRLALAAARNLRHAGADEAAAEIVENAVAALEDGEWLPELPALYGQLSAPSGKALTARIARADGWLLRHPEDNLLLLALGRMCERQQLWGKAKSYLEASLSVRASRETHLALARLLDALQETEAAHRHFRLAAELND